MPMDYSVAVDEVVAGRVAPDAEEVDRTGTFPRASISALGSAGLLGLLSSPEDGGAGAGLDAAAVVIERLARACGSTAMVVLMHYAASAVVDAHGSPEAKRAIASGRHLTTLAFSESGSRSHFWAPLSTAKAEDDKVLLDARKSWVTSAGEADSYVWSSKPLGDSGAMTLWLVPADTPGLEVHGRFDGLGLRGNASTPITATSAEIPADARLGPDGAGLDIALTTALPRFLVLNAAFSLGVMEALVAAAADHLTGTRLEHLGESLADQPARRAQFASLRTRTDEVRAFLGDTLTALATERPDAMLRVLQVKLVAAEAAAEVADGVMRLCGGSAFRKDLGIERRFRDALAARVMAPTTEALQDFVGRAALDLPLFAAEA
ncbi:acyl-CoA dehydrogenase [Amycolatopsis mediterranei S699]|uniref:Acyl-CoA dehydrogenase n=2 Tax=Amycolatopsis mediterranei TaxID=33910 RepID=A0A0H3DBP6_AMYMU|nr:acyl-CoA dehydrogenase [Amycolatopsis mediterranei U32]AFO79204.1 acyl-CoA dehydrogenase [Amycolatopsis mediterranei S699]AGT86332.1 acyl-CoA dehydrogenase [Amycolatopsis mediterranei RB]KDO12579.1 acyl-CoA dehydrogenase [Amycolatopsis mediterranei]KDU88663.1 acyl-CoA dehydrogenase [Amycolatopsis mediterranei]